MNSRSLMWATAAIFVCVSFYFIQEIQAQKDEGVIFVEPTQTQVEDASPKIQAPAKKLNPPKQKQTVKKTDTIPAADLKTLLETKSPVKAPERVKSSLPLPKIPLTPFVPENP